MARGALQWHACPSAAVTATLTALPPSSRALRKAVEIYTQLEGHLQTLGLPIKSCGNDPVPVCRALTAGECSGTTNPLLAPLVNGYQRCDAVFWHLSSKPAIYSSFCN